MRSDHSPAFITLYTASIVSSNVSKLAINPVAWQKINPFTLDKSITFLTIQVHIPEAFHYESNAIFLKPTVEIWIVSHYEHMRVNNIPKVKCNRNDYLSILIDENLNGKSYGYGGLTLAINEEGTFQSDYSYRRMTFVTTDLNNSRCEYV